MQIPVVPLVDIDVSIDGTLVLTVPVKVSLCPAARTVSFSLIPTASVVISGSGQLDIKIARGGLKAEVTLLKTSLVPALAIAVKPPASLQTCITIDLVVEPLRFRLLGVYSTFTCGGWKSACRLGVCVNYPWFDWCSEKQKVILDSSAGDLRSRLFDQCDSKPKLAPLASTGVTVRQVRALVQSADYASPR